MTTDTPATPDPAAEPEIELKDPAKTLTPTLTDRLLDGFARGILNRKEPGSWFGRLGRCWRRTGAAVVWGYVLVLLAILAALHFWGETNWITSSMLYLPQQGWLIPLPFVAVVALVSYRRGLILLALCPLIVLGPYMDYNRHSGSPKGDGIVVLSNNRAETGGHSIQSYLDLHDPDLVCFQDAPGSAWHFEQRYPDRHHAEVAGFALMSRYPILEYVDHTYESGQWGAVTARFVVDYDGQQIAIWQVHFPSPRDMLLSLQGRGFFYELLGLRRRKYGPDYRGYPQFLASRTEMTKQFIADLKQEKLPYLVVGDFNMPDRGVLYESYADFLTDSFEAGGTGYGHSFPGTTRQPISGFGPWLRIDYIWHGPHWHTEYAETEPDRKSQHRATLARLTLQTP